MRMIASYDFNYNESGLTLRDMFEPLTEGPYSMLLQLNNTYYIASVKFNYGSNWLSLTIYDSEGTLVQGETYVADFPTNLLNNMALSNYGLFWYPLEKRFKFWDLQDFSSWYNSIDLNEETAYYYIFNERLPE